MIIELAASHRLPAIYGILSTAAEGGLIYYGVDVVDQFQRAAGYIDRILHGAKPADLPVQLPTKFSLTINGKTAKVLGLSPRTVHYRLREYRGEPGRRIPRDGSVSGAGGDDVLDWDLHVVQPPARGAGANESDN